MSFKNYLIEEQIVNSIIEMLYKNCMPYIKEMRKIKASHFFYRGASKSAGKKGYLEITPRKDRYPKDMPEEIHDYIDDYFYKKFGWRPRREGVFTSYKKRDVVNYGNPWIFFPIGKYDYVFSDEIDDLFGTIDESPIRAAFDDDSMDDYNWEWEWEQDYGEGSEGGSWYYQGDDTDEIDREEATLTILDSEGYDEDEDRSERIRIWAELEWVPQLSLSDFEEDKRIEQRERGIDDLNDMLGSYVNSKHLDKATNDNPKAYEMPEVMWKCKKYYIVDDYYENEINRLLLNTSNKDFKKISQMVGQKELPFKWSKKR